jgi:hypothetical protein
VRCWYQRARTPRGWNRSIETSCAMTTKEATKTIRNV